jgi:hypothetical protein
VRRFAPLVAGSTVVVVAVGLAASVNAALSHARSAEGVHGTGHHHHATTSSRLTTAELEVRARAAAAMQLRLEPVARGAARTGTTSPRRAQKDHAAKVRAAKVRAAKLKAEKARAAKAAALTQPFDVTVGTFNVLGSQNTSPGGEKPSFPPASVRSPAAAALMIKHGVDIIGTQEDQADQLNVFEARTGFAAYPGFAWGSAETDNSILYNPQKFEFVSGSKFIIPFMGRPRPQPILRLRDRATGREFYVVNTHPSAHGGRYEVERRHGEDVLVSVLRSLEATGLPVLVTGDMNDREIFYCRVAPAAALVASSGGSYADGCHPPPQPEPVDWVLGHGVTWTGYWRDTTPVTRKISDHFIVSATAHFS